MKTFLEIMKYVGGAMTVVGFSYAVGMTVADTSYLDALGETYYALDVISMWNVLCLFVVGSALLILVVILEAVFVAGERSASGGNDLLAIYGKMMEPLRERYAEKMADHQQGGMSRKEVYDKFENVDELLDILVATLIDNGPLMYRGIHPQEDRVREIMFRVIVPFFARIVAELEKSRGESNRLYGIGQEYDADIKTMRALLWDAHRDIMEWVRTATRIRREIDDPDHTPWCPHERGIQESVDLASRICAKAGEGQGDNAKN